MTRTHHNGSVGREQVLPNTESRVSEHTADEINQQIRRRTQESIKTLSASGQDEITKRLELLDKEWDIERVLETNAATLALTGLLLGVSLHRRFLVLPALVAGFLLQHAVQGWCPPLPLLRRMGFRTAREIDEEREALKVARGDYHDLKLRHRGTAATAQKILDAVER